MILLLKWAKWVKKRKTYTSMIQFFRTHQGKYQGWMWLVPQLYTIKTKQKSRFPSSFPPLFYFLSEENNPALLFTVFLFSQSSSSSPISPYRKIVCNGIMQKPDEILKASPFCVPGVFPGRESLVRILTLLFCSYLCGSLYHNKSLLSVIWPRWRDR